MLYPLICGKTAGELYVWGVVNIFIHANTSCIPVNINICHVQITLFHL